MPVVRPIIGMLLAFMTLAEATKGQSPLISNILLRGKGRKENEADDVESLLSLAKEKRQAARVAAERDMQK